jgi:hypothetical protein
MAQTTGIVLAVGAITLANEVIFAPLAAGGSITSSFNWRIIPATLGLAVALAALEHLSPGFATGLAWLALLTVLVVPFGKAPSPLENISKALGYAGKVA